MNKERVFFKLTRLTVLVSSSQLCNCTRSHGHYAERFYAGCWPVSIRCAELIINQQYKWRILGMQRCWRNILNQDDPRELGPEFAENRLMRDSTRRCQHFHDHRSRERICFVFSLLSHQEVSKYAYCDLPYCAWLWCSNVNLRQIKMMSNKQNHLKQRRLVQLIQILKRTADLHCLLRQIIFKTAYVKELRCPCERGLYEQAKYYD